MSRWFAVLSEFGEQEEWGVRQLAAHVGLPRSAVHRVLREMERLGILADASAPGKRGRLRIGPEMFRLALLFADRIDVTAIAGPVMDRARDELRETVILTLYSAERRQFWAVRAAEAPHPMGYIWGSLRAWSDIHLGASGKSILASLQPFERDAVIDALPDPISPQRPVSKAQLREELDEIRQVGYAISHGERFAHAIGVAAPIVSGHGRVVGALVAAWPEDRMDPGKELRAAQTVAAASLEVSRALGMPQNEQASRGAQR